MCLGCLAKIEFTKLSAQLITLCSNQNLILRIPTHFLGLPLRSGYISLMTVLNGGNEAG